MSRPDEIRVLLSKVHTKLEEVRGHDAVAKRVKDVEKTLDELKVALPKDVLGNRKDDWAGLEDEERDELRSRLDDVHRRLVTIESHCLHADSGEIRFTCVYAMVMFLAFLAVIFFCICKGAVPGIAATNSPENESAVHSDETEAESRTGDGEAESKPDDESEPTNDDSESDSAKVESKTKATPHRSYGYLMLLGLGGFGACVRMMSSTSRYLGQDQFYRSWRWYYFFMPFEGAGMAFVVCLLLSADIFSPTQGTEQSAGVFFIYGMAGIAGMFSNNVSAKLRELAIVLFGKPSSKDSA